ncbi:MAG: TorF family putative porin [Halothiobacillaceae bacterium]
MKLRINPLRTGLLLALGLATAPVFAADAPAEAAPAYTLTGNLGLASDYVFRGVSQTQNQPAVSGGVDFGISGFYLGMWASNVAWVSDSNLKDNNSLEVDFYGGYKGALTEDFGYDLGVITYYYPGDDVDGATTPDTTEIYAGLSWKTLSLKYNYTVSDYFVGWTTTEGGKTQGSYYIDLSGTYDLGDGWGVLGHVGYQNVKDNSDASYTDWKLGVSKDVGFGVFTLAYTDTDAKKETYTFGLDNPKEVADAKAVLTFSKSF